MSWVLERYDDDGSPALDGNKFRLSLMVDLCRVHYDFYMKNGAFRSGENLHDPTTGRHLISLDKANKRITLISTESDLVLVLPQESFDKLYQTVITDVIDNPVVPPFSENQLKEDEYSPRILAAAAAGGRRHKQTHRRRRIRKTTKN